ncbi:MAG: hypothetical protein ACR2PM_21025 [Hyphomicrobiales bacterium]
MRSKNKNPHLGPDRAAARYPALVICLLALFSAATAEPARAGEIDVTGYWTQKGDYRIRTLDKRHAIGMAESSGSFSLEGQGLKLDDLKTECYWLAEFSSWTDIRCVASEDSANFLLFSVLMKIDRKGVSSGSAEIVSGTGKFAKMRGRFSVVWDFADNAENLKFNGFSLELKGKVTLGSDQ